MIPDSCPHCGNDNPELIESDGHNRICIHPCEYDEQSPQGREETDAPFCGHVWNLIDHSFQLGKAKAKEEMVRGFTPPYMRKRMNSLPCETIGALVGLAFRGQKPAVHQYLTAKRQHRLDAFRHPHPNRVDICAGQRLIDDDGELWLVVEVGEVDGVYIIDRDGRYHHALKAEMGRRWRRI